MNKYVLIVNGVARSGKDTFIDVLKASGKIELVYRTSTIDLVKDIAVQMGCDVMNKSDKNRRFLSDIKMLWTEFNNGIFKEITEMVGRALSQAEPAEVAQVATIMCREPQEIAKFVAFYGPRMCKTILIRREGLHTPDNFGDQSVFDYRYDYYIQNDGDIELLKDAGLAFIEDLAAEQQNFYRRQQ